MQASTNVLIVGAGPVGLTVAAELQRRGIDHLIIDQRPRPEYYCKALGITPRTLEVWDQMGLLDDALRRGCFLRGITGAVNGEHSGTELVPTDSMPYGFLSLAQYDTEELMRRQLSRHGGRVQQGVALSSVASATDGFVARVRDGDAERTVECRYLVGCDGAHSTVRKQLGLAYQGDAYAMTFMLGDVRLQWDRPHHFGHRFTLLVDGQLQNVLVCIPIPGDPLRYRISMGAPPEYWDEHADLATPPTLEQLAAAAAPLLPQGVGIADLKWASFYRISHRIVSQYSKGGAFLVGDAAHIHPPIGGQGMNTGIQDAHNLAWKLALAARGRAAAGLLDSYDAERRPVGLSVVERTTHRMDDSLTDGSVKFDQWMEDSQLLINYRGSSWVDEDNAAAPGPRAGDRAPQIDDLRRAWVARPTRLIELLQGGTHTLLLYFATGSTAQEFQRADALVDALRAVHGADIATYGIVDPTVQIVDNERMPLLVDATGSFSTSYAADRSRLCLIRPDGYIGFRAADLDGARLESYLRRIFV